MSVLFPQFGGTLLIPQNDGMAFGKVGTLAVSHQNDSVKLIYPYINSWICIILILLISASCQKKETRIENTLFVLLPSDSSGIDFVNRITPDEVTNILTYTYL